jgi:hypothetical protein
MVYPMTIVYYSSYILYDCVNETSLNSFAIYCKENHPYLFVLCVKDHYNMD